MNIKDYMKWTRNTAIYKDSNVRFSDIHDIMYVSLGLAGECGEVANKVKKLYRDCDPNLDALSDEIEDVFWYLVRLCDELNLDPEEIMDNNFQKLESRKARHALGGSGDKR